MFGSFTTDRIKSCKNRRDILKLGLEMNLHYPTGPVYTSLHKQLASLCLKNGDDLEGIYHLTEAHYPTLRVRSCIQYTTVKNSEKELQQMFNQEYVSFECHTKKHHENSTQWESMLNKIEELPKEWTVVQLTAAYNPEESAMCNKKLLNRSPVIHLTVFDCGQRKSNPVCVTVDEPKDSNICEEFQALVNDVSLKGGNAEYWRAIDIKLRKIVNDMEHNWLREWKILLLGKLILSKSENSKIDSEINTIIEDSDKNKKLSSSTKTLLRYLILGSVYLHPKSLKNALDFCISDDTELSGSIYRSILMFSQMYKVTLRGKRHPVILVVDQRLDCLPWQMCSLIENQPISRLPSLHFIHGLYKEHENNIVEGVKININPRKGSFLINPGLDLPQMEKRMNMFYKYWLPTWQGMSGITPTSDQFASLLQSSDIFGYCGHGSGIQFLTEDKIQQIRVSAVVFLFGCSSVGLRDLGGRIEMTGLHDQYLIACNPCVIGNLYNVGDKDLDMLSACLLSCWLPSNSDSSGSETTSWAFVDKDKWRRGLGVEIRERITSDDVSIKEPELLRAICAARKTDISYWTACSIIARGLPVKVDV